MKKYLNITIEESVWYVYIIYYIPSLVLVIWNVQKLKICQTQRLDAILEFDAVQLNISDLTS